VIIPLYAATFNPSPFVFGRVFGASHLLPLLFSIHAGALMDRLGSRRMMVYCTSLVTILPLAYPLAPGITVLILLQLLLGLTESLGWLGAQTMIGQYMHGRTKYAGRLSFVIRFGQLCAPPMAGMVWDLFGVWGAFILMSVWASGAIFFALALPQQPKSGHPLEVETAPSGKLRDLMPRLDDYLLAFRLMRVPAVAMIVALGAMMHMGNAVQSSFYVAWLNEKGITGTAIGLLSPAGAIGAAVFSLLTTRLMRYIDGFWIVLLSLWIGILLVCATPLLGTYFLLQMAMFLRSGLNGLAQPLVMGAIAEAVGLEMAFYATGLLLSLSMGWMAFNLHKRTDIASAGED
jgi:MFS family permease